MTDGSWRRMKACAADDCRHAFYDHTRNRSGRWCDVAGCGANARMREFRRRRGGLSA
ncbi:CGNR zinc finger domain-containing protein [Actinoallomurus sp. CA-150999]|uniref:CGNR zinc finger domain-containing protein n=1 Tax=Actinoallomurus sp. CA-150999 TaxID=3239887 RepID=UPI003D8CE423